MKKIIFALLAVCLLSSGCQERKEDNVIKIGAILPLTGSASYAAEFMKKGLDLAIRELNDTSEYEYKLIYEDSKSLPKDGLISYNKLRSQNVDFIICALSNVGMAIAPKTNNEDVILFGTAIVPSDFVTISNKTIRVYPNSEGMASVVAEHNNNTLKSKRPAVIYINNDMGIDCLKAYSNIVLKYNNQVVYSESYEPNQKDFKDIINKILQNHVDCVYVSGFGESYISFVKQFNNDPRTHNIILTGDMTFGLPDTKSKIGITSSVIHYADAIITSDFSKTYKNAYSESPNSYAAYTYTVPFLIQAALDNGCKLNNIDGIYKYITTTSFDSAMGSLCFTCDGESNLQFSMKTLE